MGILWLQEGILDADHTQESQDWAARTGVIPLAPPFPSRNYVMIAIYWFAISFLWGGFLSVVLPVFNEPLAAPIFGSNNVETARGIMTGLGLIIAMFVSRFRAL